MTSSLSVVGVTNMHLFFHTCPCGELNVHGFWQQLDRVVDAGRKLVYVRMPCRKCGKVKMRTYRLTAGRGYRRLVHWTRVFFMISRFVPNRWWRRAAGLFFWLEMKVRL